MASDPRGEPYLAGLDLIGRRVVIIGAGRVAERRLPKLLEAGAAVTLIAPHASIMITELAARGRVEWLRRPYADGDLAACWYVLSATHDPVCNAAVSVEAERQGVFCVRCDDAGEGSAWTPATAVAGDMALALLSRRAALHGSPARTRDFRDRLHELLRRLLDDERP